MVFLLEFLKILLAYRKLGKKYNNIRLSLNFGYNFSLIKIILLLLSLFTELTLINIFSFFILFIFIL